MDRYAVVKSGTVTNIIVWDGGEDWSPPDGSTAIELSQGASVDIGWLYDGAEFSAPVET